MQIDFTQNYFELFNVPLQYPLEQSALATRYRQLQKQFHPDNYAAKTAAEQRLAIQFSAYINTAYQTLKSFALRAEYLLSLQGHTVNYQTTTISDHAFLMLQMQWREALSEIKSSNNISTNEAEIEQLNHVVNTEASALQDTFNMQYLENNITAAMQSVAKLYFVEKMQSEINTVEV